MTTQSALGEHSAALITSSRQKESLDGSSLGRVLGPIAIATCGSPARNDADAVST